MSDSERSDGGLPAAKRILAIGAHAADMEFTCGMTLAKYIAAGGAAVYLHLTPGERGHPTKTAAEYREQKREEAARAAAILGAEMRMLSYEDGELPYNDTIAFEVCDVIRVVKPDIIITHWRNSIHKDHARTHQIVQDAIFYAALPTFERPLPNHRVSGVFYTDNWEDQEGYEPNVFVDIDDASFDKWRESAAAYQLFRGGVSQFRYADYYVALATMRGCLSGPKRANAFRTSPRRHVGEWLQP